MSEMLPGPERWLFLDRTSESCHSGPSKAMSVDDLTHAVLMQHPLRPNTPIHAIQQQPINVSSRRNLPLACASASRNTAHIAAPSQGHRRSSKALPDRESELTTSEARSVDRTRRLGSHYRELKAILLNVFSLIPICLPKLLPARRSGTALSVGEYRRSRPPFEHNRTP